MNCRMRFLILLLKHQRIKWYIGSLLTQIYLHLRMQYL